ncbi:MAG: flagellar filament capping protein FliD [Moraxellaceae bacterium]|nr:flagellar filament capping protein FliD [Moraxellaceae bacterium]MDP1775750.1 flagellar filament capping protein FliD [Moraxellaceae bacterium]
MAGISAGGIGSGLDVTGLVRQLVDAERAPVLSRLQKQESKADSRISAFGNLTNALDAFKTSLAKLKTAASLNGRLAVSANEELLKAAATSKATAGQYSVEVKALAQTHKLASAGFASQSAVVGSGEITMSNAKGDNFSLMIAAGVNDSLASIRDAINNDPDNNVVSASIIKSDTGFNLVLTAKQSGLDGALTISTTTDGSDSGDLSQLSFDPQSGSNPLMIKAAAQDALIEIDGFVRSSSSNKVTDMIEGVTLDLVKAQPGTVFNLSVSADTDASKKSINDFVAAYNEINKRIESLTRFDATTGFAGTLQGDATVNRLASSLRNEINRMVGGSGDLQSLFELGITSDKSGNLVVNESKLDAALSSGLAKVSAFFEGSTGLAARLTETLSQFTGSQGLITSRTESLRNEKSNIADQRDRLSLRVEAIEKRYLAQFTMLDTLIAQMNNTSQFLSRQLAGL